MADTEIKWVQTQHYRDTKGRLHPLPLLPIGLEWVSASEGDVAGSQIDGKKFLVVETTFDTYRFVTRERRRGALR